MIMALHDEEHILVYLGKNDLDSNNYSTNECDYSKQLLLILNYCALKHLVNQIQPINSSNTHVKSVNTNQHFTPFFSNHSNLIWNQHEKMNLNENKKA